MFHLASTYADVTLYVCTLSHAHAHRRFVGIVFCFVVCFKFFKFLSFRLFNKKTFNLILLVTLNNDSFLVGTVIQNRMPDARVVYCSATGASEPRNMGYMARLGLWGSGTDFPQFSAFLGTC